MVLGDDDDDDDDNDKGIPAEMEENELFHHTDFSDAIDIGGYIAIYSHCNANEPFYICKVLKRVCRIKHQQQKQSFHTCRKSLSCLQLLSEGV